MKKIRVLVVDDSVTVRKYIVDVLSAEAGLEVVGEADNGKSAIELCETLRPDVVTLDMMLPVMSGLTATEYIMAYCPTPILIVSASSNRGEVLKTYDALAAGAVDVLDKPEGSLAGRPWEKAFVARVKLVAKIKVITHIRAKLTPKERVSEDSASEKMPTSVKQYQCLALGASTGGPGAVLDILRGLPHNFPLPILLVIHIGVPFGEGLATWLDGLSPIRVVQATNGQVVQLPGPTKVFMAPADRHMIVRGGRVWLTDDAEKHSCRPSVDVLFESVATEFGDAALACLLTGMGRDGALGLAAVRNAGGATIAQDEATSVVFGMPHEAIKIGAAEYILPLQRIAPTICSLGVSQAIGKRSRR